ncbi:MAG: peptide deformylase [Bacteroides sp.]|nr:MAG: peptide deformylase [Bacteroides sp.]
MILPIIAYGNAILNRLANDVEKQNINKLDSTIKNMFDTLYNSNGIGLAAPQINLPIKLFIMDLYDDINKERIKKVFINPYIKSYHGITWRLNEGCLSIPNVLLNIKRHYKIIIKYIDTSLSIHEDAYTGLSARVIQHEIDHINGITILDRCSQRDKLKINPHLINIKKGNIETTYKMIFSKKII